MDRSVSSAHDQGAAAETVEHLVESRRLGEIHDLHLTATDQLVARQGDPVSSFLAGPGVADQHEALHRVIMPLGGAAPRGGAYGIPREVETSAPRTSGHACSPSPRRPVDHLAAASAPLRGPGTTTAQLA